MVGQGQIFALRRLRTPSAPPVGERLGRPQILRPGFLEHDHLALALTLAFDPPRKPAALCLDHPGGVPSRQLVDRQPCLDTRLPASAPLGTAIVATSPSAVATKSIARIGISMHLTHLLSLGRPNARARDDGGAGY